MVEAAALPPNTWTVALMWGPGVLILAGLFAIIAPISRKMTTARIEHERRLVQAVESQAAASQMQADAMERLSQCFKDHVAEDRSERRELTIAIRSQGAEIRDLSQRIDLVLMKGGGGE